MAEAKLEVKIGGVSFTGEGSEKWLSEQLKTILEAAPKIAEEDSGDAADEETPKKTKSSGGAFNQSLGTYLSRAGNNQVKRYLVTADWLRLKGQPLSTAAVSKALKDHHQTKLGNPSDCLNQNVGKGFAEKTASGFFITPEGLKSLGHTV